MNLTDDYIDQAQRDARRFAGAYTGTAGTLAAHTLRLIAHRRMLMKQIEELRDANQELRQVVDSLPAEIMDRYAQFTITRAMVPKPISVEPHPVGRSHDPAVLEAAWGGIKRRREEMLAKIAEPEPQPKATTFRVIGLCGRAGSGKSTAAACIPGAVVLQLADPIYAMLAVMLGVPESLLRDQTYKSSTVPGLGVTVRKLLQTLGTEWGRNTVREDVWIQATARRLDALRAAGISTVAIADVRFDNEVQALRGMGAEVWEIARDLGSSNDTHSSEAGVSGELIDKRVDNTGTIDDLRRAVLRAFSA